jgi:hypothetical protein
MNRFLLGLAVLLGSTNALQASSLTCSNNTSSFSASGCISATNFTGMDFVNWGSSTAFGEAFQGMTSNGLVNPHNVVDSSPSWDAQSQGGQTVMVSLIHPTVPYIVRTDNTLMAGDSTHWDLANAIVTEEYGSGSIYTYDGHFGAPTSLPTTGYTGFGDALIGEGDASGAINGLGPMMFTFDSAISAGGLRISSVGDTDFGAVLTAYDAANNVLWTYTIKAFGSGGECDSLLLVAKGAAPCNDAPWLGFTGLVGVTHFAVDAFKLVEGELTHQEVGFLVDQLELSGGVVTTTAPEPELMFLTGGAMLALVSLARKRKRSQQV